MCISDLSPFTVHIQGCCGGGGGRVLSHRPEFHIPAFGFMSGEVSGKSITLGLCKGLFEESQLFGGKMQNTFIFLAPVLCELLFSAGMQIPSRINPPDSTAFQKFQKFYLYKREVLKSHFQLFNASTQTYSGCLYNNLPSLLVLLLSCFSRI